MKLQIKNKYGITPNNILNDEKLSLKAKGLFGYLQSKPDNWKFSIPRIAIQQKEGKSAIREAIKELEQHKFLKRIPATNKNGKWDGYDYKLFNTPFDFRTSYNPTTDLCNTISKKDIVKKKKNMSATANPLSKQELERKKIHKDITELFDFYKALFTKRISSAEPVFNWAICEKNARPFMKQFGLEKMKKFCDYYLGATNKNDKEKFKNCSWSLSCFLSTHSIHIISIKIN